MSEIKKEEAKVCEEPKVYETTVYAINDDGTVYECKPIDKTEEAFKAALKKAQKANPDSKAKPVATLYIKHAPTITYEGAEFYVTYVTTKLSAGCTEKAVATAAKNLRKANESCAAEWLGYVTTTTEEDADQGTFSIVLYAPKNVEATVNSESIKQTSEEIDAWEKRQKTAISKRVGGGVDLTAAKAAAEAKKPAPTPAKPAKADPPATAKADPPAPAKPAKADPPAPAKTSTTPPAPAKPAKADPPATAKADPPATAKTSTTPPAPAKPAKADPPAPAKPAKTDPPAPAKKPSTMLDMFRANLVKQGFNPDTFC